MRCIKKLMNYTKDDDSVCFTYMCHEAELSLGTLLIFHQYPYNNLGQLELRELTRQVWVNTVLITALHRNSESVSLLSSSALFICFRR